MDGSERLGERNLMAGAFGILIALAGMLLLRLGVRGLLRAIEGGLATGATFRLLLVVLFCLALLGVGLLMCAHGFLGLRRAARLGWFLGGVVFGSLALLFASFGAYGLHDALQARHPHNAGFRIFAGLVFLLGGVSWGGAAALLVRRSSSRALSVAWGVWMQRAVVGVVVWFGVLLVLAGVATTCSHGHTHHESDCMNTVRNMSMILCERSIRKRWPPHGGKNFVLSLAAYRLVDARNPANLRVFYCDRAETPASVLDPAAWADVTPENLRTRRFPHLTSYAGRRNDDPRYALTKDSDLHAEAIIACPCHEDGVIVGFADGRALFMEWEDLGISPDDPVLFGEESASALLRALSDE